MPFLWISLGVAISAVVIWLALDARKYRVMYFEIDSSYADMTERAMISEREAGRAEKDAEFHRQTIAMILNRPAISVLSEEQFGQLVNTVIAAVQGAAKNPNQLN